MKRNAFIALGYGLGGLVVCLLWVGRGLSWKPGADEARGSGGGMGSVLGNGTEEWVQFEVGPDGLRPIPTAGDEPEVSVVTMGETAGKEPREGQASKQRGEGNAPRLASELLALGDPVIEAVADLLRAEGIPEAMLEGTLGDVYAHVQRLAAFKVYAEQDREVAEAMESRAMAVDESERPGMPSLKWRVEVWPRRSLEYAGYVGRDLEMRLGIQDEAVVKRLVEIADLASGQYVNAAPSGGMERGGSEKDR